MSDTVVYNEQTVKERYDGLVPSQLIDYKGLRGDPSDNISGVPGIGEKTAIGLLKEFGSMDEMYKEIGGKEYKELKIERYKEVKMTERIFNLLNDNKEKAMQSRKLAEIIRNVDVDFNLKDCVLKTYDKNKVFEVFQRLEFKSLLNRLPEFGEEEGERGHEKAKEGKEDNVDGIGEAVDKHAKHDYKHVSEEKDFEAFFKELKKQKEFCFDTESTGLDVFTEKLLGVSFCWENGRAFFVDAKKDWLERLKPIFADEKARKIGHNLKFDAKILRVNGVETNNFYFDTMIASYLLNPGTRAHNLDDLAFRELGYQKTKLAQVSKKTGQASIEFIDKGSLSDYSCEDADYTWRLVEKLKPELEKNEMWPLFEKIEMPLIEVLIEMEMNGVKIDTDHLKKMSKSVNAKIAGLTKKIHKLAGEKFNISSPLQLKKILFEKLNLSKEGLGKTKTGISTAAGELEKLHDLHPIIELIEEYRELTKLESTYIDALPKLICKNTGRLHTDFNQTITATGRLSSSNPNLQNIPIRTPLGKEMRKAFIAEPGNWLISADYSQIELRIIACLSGDKNMIKIFEQGLDIHRATAAKIFNVPLEKVNDDMRSAAKEVKFGVLYGMGAWGLARRKKISREKAKEFIDKYFETFSGVKNYIEKMKDSAREKGYAETMFGRRRYLPEINSGVQQIRAAAERMAINMPIQGTAADLIKIAMVEIHQEIKKTRNQENSKTIKQQNNRIKML
ncbi:MAG: DNA polymerase I, partial [Parcubacteria group bacterium]